MNYRLVLLSSSGEPASFEDWTCASDVEAMDRAAAHAKAYGAQLWRGERCVSTFAGPLSARPADAQPGAPA